MKVVPFGESALLVDLEIAGDPNRARKTHAAARHLKRQFPTAEIVVGAGNVLVAGISPDTSSPELSLHDDVNWSGAHHSIRAVYDGPDLKDVASRCGLTQADVVRVHSRERYTVDHLGFLPGFAYLRSVHAALVIPRRQNPRPRVAAFSIGIAADMTGIYPFDSPGGWHLLARALGVSLFDAHKNPPTLLLPGDTVSFVPSDDEPAPPAVLDEETPAARGLRILKANPRTTIQDSGRFGQLAYGLPPSGPFDVVTHDAANRAVSNLASAAAIEIALGDVQVQALSAQTISIDGSAAQTLSDGETLTVPSRAGRAFRYLAIAGGVNVPLVLGSGSTLLVANTGGFRGRALRAGDVVPVGDERAQRGSEDAEASDTVEIVRGPHADAFPETAIETLMTTSWRISPMFDRVGVRLDGGKIPTQHTGTMPPCPVLRGAMQVTTDGTPIILGPDHPSTGGYPVLAVVTAQGWRTLGQRGPGALVKFRLR